VESTNNLGVNDLLW